MFVNLQLGETVITPRVRLLEPLNLMKEKYGVNYEIAENTLYLNDDEPFLIRARVCNTNMTAGIRLPIDLYEDRCVYLYEIDDSISNVEGYKKSEYIDFIGAHAVTCSTEALASELMVFNPNVKVFKNQITNLLPEKKFEKRDTVKIFFGALNRGESFEEILRVLNKIAKKYDKKLSFTVIYDTNFYTKLHTPYKTFVKDNEENNLVSYDTYMKELASSDIALLPLKDTVFNRAKSDLKFIESANAGATVLASPTVYKETVKDGKTGFIYKNAKEFQEKLEILIKNPQKRIDLAKAAYEYVKRERLLERHIDERYDWMRETYAKREELQKEVLKRYEVLLKKLDK